MLLQFLKCILTYYGVKLEHKTYVQIINIDRTYYPETSLITIPLSITNFNREQI